MKSIAGFPYCAFRLSDIWAIHSEHASESGTITVTGMLPGGERIKAVFPKQRGPKGSWTATLLEPLQEKEAEQWLPMMAKAA